MLVLIGLVFGFGLGNTIAPSTTRMTLATPPQRSGSGSAVQNTVRQVGAVFGVAILSSVVGTVYSNNMSPLLEGKPLPPEALKAATDSIGGTNEVADQLAATGSVPAATIEQLRQASYDSFMPALHTAAFVSAGLLVIAIAVILLRLPAKAEAAAWAGSGPHAIPDGDCCDGGALRRRGRQRAQWRRNAAGSLGDGEAGPAAADLVSPDQASPDHVGGKHALDDVATTNGALRKHGPIGRHAAVEDDDDAVPVGAGEPTGRS